MADRYHIGANCQGLMDVMPGRYRNAPRSVPNVSEKRRRWKRVDVHADVVHADVEAAGNTLDIKAKMRRMKGIVAKTKCSDRSFGGGRGLKVIRGGGV